MMRKNLVLTIILAISLLGIVAGCAQPPEATPAPSPGIPLTGFFLTVSQPADGSIVDIGSVEVTGHTTPDAVVSINGELVEVDGEGNFTIMVVLEEGPNIIEVIASDLEGNEESRTLVIVYVP